MSALHDLPESNVKLLQILALKCFWHYSQSQPYNNNVPGRITFSFQEKNRFLSRRRKEQVKYVKNLLSLGLECLSFFWLYYLVWIVWIRPSGCLANVMPKYVMLLQSLSRVVGMLRLFTPLSAHLRDNGANFDEILQCRPTWELSGGSDFTSNYCRSNTVRLTTQNPTQLSKECWCKNSR
jgi:hypothetical protein